jgi:hypothetical protein
MNFIISIFYIIFTRIVQSIESALTKENEALSAIVLEDKIWEDKTGLKLKMGKKTVEKVAQKYGNSLKETVKMSQKLFETNNLLTSTEAERGNKKEIYDELKIVLGLLEAANNSGKESEKMLRAAQAQGEKEAAKYLKFVKTIVASTTETIPDLSKTVKTSSK